MPNVNFLPMPFLGEHIFSKSKQGMSTKDKKKQDKGEKERNMNPGLMARINGVGKYDDWMPETSDDEQCRLCHHEVVWKYGKDVYPQAQYGAAECAYLMCTNCGNCQGTSVM